jgi:hypothetical protein
MKKAVDDGIVRISHDHIDNKGLSIVAEINTAEGRSRWTTLYFCPFCGESLGDWLTDKSKCETIKERPELVEPDYDLEGEGPDAS